MSDAQSGIPAGWYRDPQGMTRWYDGTAWTEHTQPVHWVMPQTGQTVRTTRGDAVDRDDLFVEPMESGGLGESIGSGGRVDGPHGSTSSDEPSPEADGAPVLSALMIAAVVLMAAIVIVLAVLFVQL